MTINAPRSAACRALAGLLLATGLLLAVALPASAHAQLVGTSPVDGEDLDAAPEAVLLTFDEPVTSPPDAIRVFDRDGERVDVDGPVPAAAAADVVGRALPSLDDGAYVVTWRTVSEDGHPLRGAFVFTVGGADGADPSLVAALFGADDGPWSAAGVAVTAGTYLAVLLLAGALLVGRRLDVAAPGLVRAAVLVGGLLTVLAVPVQAAVTSGGGAAALVDPAQLRVVLGSSVGVAALLRLVGLVGVLVLRGRARLGAGAVALLSFVVDGHTRTVEPTWLLVGADAVHLAAGAVWFGGLAVLLVALRRRRPADDPVGGAVLLAGWSSLATLAVGGVVLGGVALAWATVRSTAALLPTAYGQLLLTKLALAGVLLAIGAWNHWRLVPAVRAAAVPVPAGGSEDVLPHLDAQAAPGDAGAGGRALLQRVVAVELVLLVAVLGVTGALTSQRPAAEAAGLLGDFQTTVALTDELDLDLVVDPNVAGVNSVHLYLLDQTGRPVDAIEDITMSFSLPARDLGPIERDPLVAGPGHWVLTGNELALPGTWEVVVTARVDRFTEAVAEVTVLVGGTS